MLCYSSFDTTSTEASAPAVLSLFLGWHYLRDLAHPNFRWLLSSPIATYWCVQLVRINLVLFVHYMHFSWRLLTVLDDEIRQFTLYLYITVNVQKMVGI